jgi:hypothetical protein
VVFEVRQQQAPDLGDQGRRQMFAGSQEVADLAKDPGPALGSAIAVRSAGGSGTIGSAFAPAEGFGAEIASTGFSTGFGSTLTSSASSASTGW